MPRSRFCIDVYLLDLSIVLQATLVSNVDVTCPGDPVTFTCTIAGGILQWEMSPPPGTSFSIFDDTVSENTPINVSMIVGSQAGFQFERVRTVSNQGELRSTLTTVSNNLSSLNGTIVTCQTQGSLTIQVAGMLHSE